MVADLIGGKDIGRKFFTEVARILDEQSIGVYFSDVDMISDSE